MKRFSIVIPTRQRHETLGSTINTVLSQDFDDYEVIVSDNFSSHETKSVIESFNSTRIVYVRSESPLAMSDNWELALSHAKGEYIIFLGDDDGLIAGSLRALDNVISQTDYKLIRWERVYYSWPNMQPEVFANKLHIKFTYENRIIDGRKIIGDVINERIDYTFLPMLYNSAVHHSLIENHVKATGRFFHSIVPDLYSGFVLAHLSESFLSLGTPMSINAGSAKSNGASFMFKKKAQAINDDYKQLNDSGTLIFDESIPYVRSIFIAVFESYVKFISNIKCKDYVFDRTKAFLRIIQSMTVYDVEELNEFTSKIVAAAKKQNLDLSLINENLARVKVSDIDAFEAPKCGFSDRELIVDASKFDIATVFDVSVFVRKFYDFEIFEKDKFSINAVRSTAALKMPIKARIKKAIKILYKGRI